MTMRGRMAKTIQIRNVPVEVHRKLKGRAGRLNMTLSGYLLREFRQLAEQPTVEELVERIRRRAPSRSRRSSAATIRRFRDAL